MSAPVRHTCPDIDKIIKAIRGAIKTLDDIRKLDDIDEAKDYAHYAINDIDGLEYILEDLRSDNDKLRTWGHELEDRVEELENEIYELNNQES